MARVLSCSYRDDGFKLDIKFLCLFQRPLDGIPLRVKKLWYLKLQLSGTFYVGAADVRRWGCCVCCYAADEERDIVCLSSLCAEKGTCLS